MKTQVKYLVLAGAAAALAGCGGSGGTTLTTAPTYAQLLDRATTMADDTGVIDSNTGELIGTERTVVPTSGTADYKGYVGGEVDGGGFIGELTLTADFSGGGSVSGSATNFQHETNGAYTGALAMPSTGISANLAGDQEFAGTLSGDLTNDGTVNATNIALTGYFFGGTDDALTQPTTAAGYADGTVGGTLLNDGIFIATQTP
ncbi:hypothetical protein [Thioclava pacifica]|uniref:Transferrin-binding protein B C-lobe/N-lobe beta barrel domain-containing protein n=1 Tax=Thioclava pacifica DSM 10166 TaxID=1353537 RepID=A0A074JKT9_9RHOB|nr:hypothetical protein [Thioclava pacifica]KEO56510.1 hypothetical protein TP2_02995 [Thioclava pacifica DSM 10166]